MDVLVSVSVKLEGFRPLLHHIATLPRPFRPTHFTVGERVRNKESSRIDDVSRFSDFVDDRVGRLSGCDLVGEKIRYGIFVGATRTAKQEPTHIGCSVIMRGAHWRPVDYESLLRRLCAVPGVECGDACLRDEWRHRHVCVKALGDTSIQTTLGVDISAQLPGLYWWTVFSDELVQRHQLDRAELDSFSESSERWGGGEGSLLNAFRLYECPEAWCEQDARISSFLHRHLNFFSLTRIQSKIDAAQTKEEFDAAVRPYRAGALPWESQPDQ